MSHSSLVSPLPTASPFSNQGQHQTAMQQHSSPACSLCSRLRGVLCIWTTSIHGRTSPGSRHTIEPLLANIIRPLSIIITITVCEEERPKETAWTLLIFFCLLQPLTATPRSICRNILPVAAVTGELRSSSMP